MQEDCLACVTTLLLKARNPVQRIVYYFAEALNERIDCQWGINSSKNLEGQLRMTMDKELALISLQPAMIAGQQEHPFTLITQCAAAETILENVASAKRLHLIDFSIDNGSHWIPMMQAFAARCECPLDLLKITAAGTCKHLMEETGKWLSSFAETINLPFSFKILLSDLKNLQEDLFELEVDEAVAIYSAFRLWTQLPWPNQLEALIGVIKNLKPSVMVVIELELSTTTPIFLERFNDTLLYLSAMFDYLTACLANQILCRKLLEEVYLREMIRNVVTVEGSERYQQHERVSFWRSLFERCGFVETDLSHLSFLQANLLLSRSEYLSSCSRAMDGKCLILGWKGNPIESISAWKLASDRLSD